MSSKPLGKSTSKAEVTNVSAYGIWLLAKEQEFFLSYEDFPWFKDVPPKKVFRVEEPAPGHLHWPDLDVDLGIESLRHRERFPLRAKLSKKVSGVKRAAHKSKHHAKRL